MDLLQVPSDYIIGPGDELQVRIWGQVEADLRVIVDRSGQIYIPQVGQISVAGIHYGDLEQHLKREISKIFRNFNITANVGRLRSIRNRYHQAVWRPAQGDPNGVISCATRAFHITHNATDIVDGQPKRVQRSERLCTQNNKRHSTNYSPYSNSRLRSGSE